MAKKLPITKVSNPLTAGDSLLAAVDELNHGRYLVRALDLAVAGLGGSSERNALSALVCAAEGSLDSAVAILEHLRAHLPNPAR